MGVLTGPGELLPGQSWDDDHKPRKGKEDRHQHNSTSERYCPKATGERLEEEPVHDHGREEPAVHLQGLLCPVWHPCLEKPRLRDQDNCIWSDVQALGNGKSRNEGDRVQWVDGDAPAHNVLKHTLLLGPTQVRSEQDKARQHEKPRHPSETPAEEVHLRNDARLRIEVAHNHMQGGTHPSKAQGELVPSTLWFRVDLGKLGSSAGFCRRAARLGGVCMRGFLHLDGNSRSSWVWAPW
mmetsp:Transcript_82082/g.232441  ORF Transcript_82082/g.232441 Transcript_82082/m.232441 type:complete len:238 (+) Transcript_82082:1978-2691(+)